MPIFSWRWVVFLSLAVAGCVGPRNQSQCTDGEQRCVANQHSVCRGGELTETVSCPSVCSETAGCVLCEPGTGTCDGEVARVCAENGMSFVDTFCDDKQGMSCDATSGHCTGACAPENVGTSYIGCEYFPTVMRNLVASSFAFAVVVTNTTESAADVRIEGGALAVPLTFTVSPGGVQVQRLPWVFPLKELTTTGVLAKNGAYRLRSTQPVTVYQFNPLDYTDGAGTFSFSNDASLLLPTNVLTGRYRVIGWPFWQSAFSYPGLVTITATVPDTTITINSSATSPAGSGAPAVHPGTPTTVMLERGDVLQLATYDGDFTGSEVTSNKPIQVLSGHVCTNIPSDVAACDHLEESMMPVETLATNYIVTAPAVPSLPDGMEEYIRVVAVENDTEVDVQPSVAGFPRQLAAGGFVEIPRTKGDYLVSANRKILVAQYMEGQNAGGDAGDPAMTLAVATDQYRTDYLFHAPTNYERNYVNLTAPSGTNVTLDGVPVPSTAWKPIATTMYQVARLTVDSTNLGNHRITGDHPFGIQVYGYGMATSYWYPGGLNLAEFLLAKPAKKDPPL